MSKNPSGMTIMFEHQDNIEMLSDDEAGKVFKALFKYCLNGDKGDWQGCDRCVKMAFDGIVKQLDRSLNKYKSLCEKNSTAARQRWESNQSEANECECIEENADVCECISDDTKKCERINSEANECECIEENAKNANSKCNRNPNRNPKCNRKREGEANEPVGSAHAPPPKKIKRKYGEYSHVLLTDEEYSKLVSDYGDKRIKEYIKRVDEYVQKHDKVYKDYDLVIRTWLRDDNVRKKPNANGTYELELGQPSYDLEEIMAND